MNLRKSYKIYKNSINFVTINTRNGFLCCFIGITYLTIRRNNNEPKWKLMNYLHYKIA